MKIAAFAGVLRNESVSKKLILEAGGHLASHHGLPVDYLNLKEFPFPLYDTDFEIELGIPEGIASLARRIAAADALIVAAPEHNGGISSVLKALLDWLSRVKPMPLAGKFLLLTGTSPSGAGGVAGLWHTRVPFESLGVHVYPAMLAIPRSASAFDANGILVDEKARAKLEELVDAFVAHVANHHPLPVRKAS